MAKQKSGNTIGNCGTVNTASIKLGHAKGVKPTQDGSWALGGAPDPEAGTNGCGPMPGPRTK
jgi:hypothetical protein